MNSVADNPLELFLRAEAATENLLPKVAILHQQKKIATGDRWKLTPMEKACEEGINYWRKAWVKMNQKWKKKKKLLQKLELPWLTMLSNCQFFGVMLTVCYRALTVVLPRQNRTGQQKLFLISIPIHFSLQSLKYTSGEYLDWSDIDEAYIKKWYILSSHSKSNS